MDLSFAGHPGLVRPQLNLGNLGLLRKQSPEDTTSMTVENVSPNSPNGASDSIAGRGFSRVVGRSTGAPLSPRAQSHSLSQSRTHSHSPSMSRKARTEALTPSAPPVMATPVASASNTRPSKRSAGVSASWTKEEDDKFVAALKKHGRNWKEIKKGLPTHTAMQVRQHAQQHFSKLAKDSPLPTKNSTHRKRKVAAVAKVKQRPQQANLKKSRLLGPIVAAFAVTKQRPRSLSETSTCTTDDEKLHTPLQTQKIGSKTKRVRKKDRSKRTNKLQAKAATQASNNSQRHTARARCNHKVQTAPGITNKNQSSAYGDEYKKKSGRWTEAEHKTFLRGLRKYGRNWSAISQMVRSRTTVQVRTHAQKYFLKQSKEAAAHASKTMGKSTSTPAKPKPKLAVNVTPPKKLLQSEAIEKATVDSKPPTKGCKSTNPWKGHSLRVAASPASQRTIQTAAAHLLRLFDFSRRYSLPTSAVY